MLTIFYFDSELFEDESLNLMPMANQSILDNWEKYGCLAVCPKSLGALIKAVQQIHSDYRQKWIAAFTSSSFKKITINVKESKLSAIADLQEFTKQYLCETVTTGLIATEYTELYEQKFFVTNKTLIEIITPINFNESKNFSNSEEISNKDIKRTDTFDEIWDTRFNELSKHTNTITILDRYLALNLQNDHNKGLVTSLERLIEKLITLNRAFVIDIFSACDIPRGNVNSGAIKTFIDNTLKNKPYFSDKKIQIKFSLCKNSKFKTAAHERMLCFDNHVIQIGNGMDIFRTKKIENNTFTIKSKKRTFFDESYKELSRNREWVY
jgi:hypothetical protein